MLKIHQSYKTPTKFVVQTELLASHHQLPFATTVKNNILMSLMSLREGVSPLNKGSDPAIFHSFLNAAVHLFPFLLRGPVENIKD